MGTARAIIVLGFLTGCQRISEAELATRLDGDGDGLTLEDDCDDRDPTAGALVASWEDADEDGFGGGPVHWSCRVPLGRSRASGDCDDSDPLVHPAAPERCRNGIDDDCSGDAGECRVHGEVSPGAAVAEVYGETINDRLGRSLAWLPDIDGDGVRDWMVGAPWAEPIAFQGSGEIGGAYLLSGAWRGAGWTEAVNAGLFPGSLPGEACGTRVAHAGDLLGWGQAAIVLGCPRVPSEGASGGRVRIRDLEDELDRSFSRTWGTTDVWGTVPGGWFGAALAGELDLDLDGATDLVVGAPHEDGGAVYLIGGPLLEGGSANDLAMAVATHPETIRFAHAVHVIGDLDQDGYPDVAVGGLTSQAEALVCVLSGAIRGTVDLGEGGCLRTWIGPAVMTSSAVDLAAADLDGDGVAELAVGIAHAGAGIDGMVTILDLNAVPPSALATWTGQDGEQLGYSVAAVGDWDGDGVVDWAAGAPFAYGNDGRVVLLPGSARGASGVDAALASFVGKNGALMGTAVIGGHDLDGDGYPDLVAGASEDWSATARAGAAYVYLGSGP